MNSEASPTHGLATPVVPVSWGDLFDKITILEIKEEKLEAVRALANVRRELELLRQFTDAIEHEDLADLIADLKAVNAQLWQIEDDIREKEREKDFTEEFTTLARAVYIQNDRRAGLKRRINLLLGSELAEEKSYKAY
ncbi:DUF6165 family protein [Sphingomonas sp. ID0503]|uniref:DUF6165 family protein n=1 Tax=Sphingomonas sp. ID0503 TaxID=3399691 RepID=UPI003AFB60BC